MKPLLLRGPQVLRSKSQDIMEQTLFLHPSRQTDRKLQAP
jgi:hypothetical protein